MAILLPTPSPSTSSTTPPSSSSSSSYYYSPVSCLATILRRILCSNGLPYSSPTNYFTKEASPGLLDKEAVKGAEATDLAPAPLGVVARLMGLNSLPAPSPQPLKGSNGGEERYRKRVDHGSLLHGVVPTSVKVETEYIVLSFIGGKRPRRGTKGKRSSCKGKARMKQQPDMEALPEHEHHHHHREDSTMLRVAEREKEDGGGGSAGACGLKNEESECGSENSSPVSVLNFGKVADRRAFVASPEEDSEPTEPGAGTSEVEGFIYESKLHKEGSSLIRADDDRDSSHSSSEETSFSCRRRTCQAPNQSALYSEIRRLSNVRVAESEWIHKTACHWVPKSVLHRKEVESISKDIELEIFSQLIEECVSHFSLTC